LTLLEIFTTSGVRAYSRGIVRDTLCGCRFA
jgi:hypothetical protein